MIYQILIRNMKKIRESGVLVERRQSSLRYGGWSPWQVTFQRWQSCKSLLHKLCRLKGKPCQGQEVAQPGFATEGADHLDHVWGRGGLDKGTSQSLLCEVQEDRQIKCKFEWVTWRLRAWGRKWILGQYEYWNWYVCWSTW
jgi:hypothetical protein